VLGRCRKFTVHFRSVVCDVDGGSSFARRCCLSSRGQFILERFSCNKQFPRALVPTLNRLWGDCSSCSVVTVCLCKFVLDATTRPTLARSSTSQSCLVYTSSTSVRTATDAINSSARPPICQRAGYDALQSGAT